MPLRDLQASQAQRWLQHRLQYWPVLPDRQPGDLASLERAIAPALVGMRTKDQRKDAEEALLVIERLLVGWHVTRCIRNNDAGWKAIRMMAIALVHATASRERQSRRGAPLSFAARLDRAVPHPALSVKVR